VNDYYLQCPECKLCICCDCECSKTQQEIEDKEQEFAVWGLN
jgi:hypothetical protein